MRDCVSKYARDTFNVSEAEHKQNTSDAYRRCERKNRDQGGNKMWSEFKAKSSRDNARTNSCETDSQERGEQCFEENSIEACNQRRRLAINIGGAKIWVTNIG